VDYLATGEITPLASAQQYKALPKKCFNCRPLFETAKQSEDTSYP